MTKSAAPPPGTDPALWARVMATAAAYRRWARRSFRRKLTRYLKRRKGQDQQP